MELFPYFICLNQYENLSGRTVQNLPIGIKEAWEFFSNPNNLSVITPEWLNFKVTSKLPDKMYTGMIISYKVHPVLGIPNTWVTEITHVKEPFYFVDEQRFGPYKFWHHQHHFKETDNGVEMTDIVNYALPFVPFDKAEDLAATDVEIDSVDGLDHPIIGEEVGSEVLYVEQHAIWVRQVHV